MVNFLTNNLLLLFIFVVGFQCVIADGEHTKSLLESLIERWRNRPRLGVIGGTELNLDLHKKITLPTLGFLQPKPVEVKSPPIIIEREKPIIIERERPIILEREKPLIIEPEKPIITHHNTIPHTRRKFRAEGTNEHWENGRLISIYEGQSLPRRTQVVNEEKEEVVEEIKRTVIEEKIPTIIKTRTPTYIQPTMQQKIIRERIPHTIQQEHTKYVTETKPIYVTRRRPVTVKRNKTIYKIRERVVNVPGAPIITKGPSVITRRRGKGSYRVLRRRDKFDDDEIGFRFLGPSTEHNSTVKIREHKKKGSHSKHMKHLRRKLRLWSCRRYF